ncbi:hypothetical protein SBADM41S_11867 [Streptomyces badius]
MVSSAAAGVLDRADAFDRATDMATALPGHRPAVPAEGCRVAALSIIAHGAARLRPPPVPAPEAPARPGRPPPPRPTWLEMHCAARSIPLPMGPLALYEYTSGALRVRTVTGEAEGGPE